MERCVGCGRVFWRRPRRLRGGGFLDSITGAVSGAWTKAKDYFRPLSDAYTRGTAFNLGRYGNQAITRIQVFRKPVAAMLDKFLNIISLGSFEAAKRKYGYEKFFHLGTYVTLADGTGLIVEKLEVINVAPGPIPSGEGAEYMEVPLASALTLSQYLENTRAAMGDSEFFNYRALPIDGKPANNCQVFVAALLRANGMLTPDLEAFIMQPIDQLAKELPGYLKDTAQFFTDAAATARKVIGLGRHRRRHIGSSRRRHWRHPERYLL